MASLDIAFGGLVKPIDRCITCLECGSIAKKCEDCSDYVCPNKHIILKNLNKRYGDCENVLCDGKEAEIREANYPNLRNPKWVVGPSVDPVKDVSCVTAGVIETKCKHCSDYVCPNKHPSSITRVVETVDLHVQKPWWKRIFCC